VGGLKRPVSAPVKRKGEFKKRGLGCVTFPPENNGKTKHPKETQKITGNEVDAEDPKAGVGSGWGKHKKKKERKRNLTTGQGPKVGSGRKKVPVLKLKSGASLARKKLPGKGRRGEGRIHRKRKVRWPESWITEEEAIGEPKN